MKQIIAVISFALLISGCATTSTSQVQPGEEAALKEVQSVYIQLFQSKNTNVAQAVQNVIMEMLLTSNIRVVIDSAKADVTVQGTITFSEDAVASGGAYIGQTAGGAYASGTSGHYVSGITARLVRNGEIVGAATETQVRTDLWIPDPPEVMARKIGTEIREMLGR